MKNLTFHLDYYTQPNERVELAYSVDGAPQQYHPLQSNNGQSWHTTLEIADESIQLRHAYQIVDEAGHVLRTEQNHWRFFQFNHRSEVCFVDAWADQSLSLIYQRSAFSQCIFTPRGGEKMHMEHLSAPCLMLLHALPPTEGKKWAIVGSSEELGEWNPSKALPLQRTGTYEWALPLSRNCFEEGFEYKYLLIDPEQPQLCQWEEGGNRKVGAYNSAQSASIIRQDELPRIQLPHWRGAGCVIPLFSLRSKDSFGVGDFGDLSTLIRWSAEVGMRAIQLLPINDTTRTGSWHDSYPYNGISVFALHPLYLNPREWKETKAYKQCAVEGEELNELPEMDYERAFALKMAFARALYTEKGRNIVATAAFKKFCKDNETWLNAYTAFCALRDLYHTANFRDWPADAPKPNEVEAFAQKHPQLQKERHFYAFVQYLLHRQMKQVHQEAQEDGVILKGDIPIGISRDSVPAWVDGQLFHFNGQAGAPPDDFATHGQNWGFPTYNWDEMSKDHYAWWRARLKHMEHYFDAYRIDHVLGFFRIWEVPSEHVYGLLGHFRPALPYTKEEIRGFGFQADIDALCVPQVSEERMQQLLTETGNTELATLYFHKAENGSYLLKDAYRKQRHILQQLPEGKTRDALLDVVCEVLFIHDSEHPELYHPRVSAQLSHLFQSLTDSDREAFNRMHDDFFYRRNNQFWADEAMKKIPVVTQSADTLAPTLQLFSLQGEGMLPCAEDLGMVPESVKGVLQRLKILSLEIQRMPKEFGMRFGNPAHNPYLSVATIATHDMEPLRLWWQQSAERAQAFWNEALHHAGQAPTEATPELCEEVIVQHLQSPSMLCLLALQDWLSISSHLRNPHPEKEQINVPANPDQYWRYRMHITLEQLIQATDFNEKVRLLIERR